MNEPDRPKDFHHRWPSLKPPLRPAPDIASQIATLLPDSALPVLQLGMTPELADTGMPKIAMDWSAAMIEAAWPGDTQSRRAMLGNWLHMPLPSGSVAAAIGDGPITMLIFPRQAEQLFGKLRDVLMSGGRMVFRCFATPGGHPSLDHLCEDVRAGRFAFHDAKLRFNMAAAREYGDAGGNIASQSLFALFQERFADREALSAATGWSLETIAEIDAYRDSSYVHCYPGRAELEKVLAGLGLSSSWVETCGYAGAELCPLLIVDMP